MVVIKNVLPFRFCFDFPSPKTIKFTHRVSAKLSPKFFQINHLHQPFIMILHIFIFKNLQMVQRNMQESLADFIKEELGKLLPNGVTTSK